MGIGGGMGVVWRWYGGGMGWYGGGMGVVWGWYGGGMGVEWGGIGVEKPQKKC